MIKMKETNFKSPSPEPEITYEILYSIYKKEFIDCCENILIEDKNELLNSFFYKIQLIIKFTYGNSIFNNDNNILELSKRCEIQFITDVYIPMYNTCIASLKKFNSLKFTSNKKKQDQILKNFLPHCLKDKKPLHTCGKKLIQVFNESSKKIDYVICPHCKKCYFSTSILMYCQICDKDYFSEILPNQNNSNNNTNISKLLNKNSRTDLNKEIILYPATWKQYHCSLMNNEQMSCINCGDKFWLNNDNKLYCKSCKIELNPLKIVWTCIICHKDFKSPAKIYNHLENKQIKKAIRDALLYERICKPNILPCHCVKENEIDKLDFVHKINDNCMGVLYYGIIGINNLIVCSCCTSMCPLDEFIWCCPICHKNFITNSIKIYANNKTKNYFSTKIIQEGKKPKSNMINLSIDECANSDTLAEEKYKEKNYNNKVNNIIKAKKLTNTNTVNFNTTESNTVKDAILLYSGNNASGGSISDNNVNNNEVSGSKRQNNNNINYLKLIINESSKKKKNIIYGLKTKAKEINFSNNNNYKKLNISNIASKNNIQNKFKIKIKNNQFETNNTISSVNNTFCKEKTKNSKQLQNYSTNNNKFQQNINVKKKSSDRNTLNSKSIDSNKKVNKFKNISKHKIAYNNNIKINISKIIKTKTQNFKNNLNSPNNNKNTSKNDALKRKINSKTIFNDEINNSKNYNSDENSPKVINLYNSDKENSRQNKDLYKKAKKFPYNSKAHNILFIDNKSNNERKFNRSNSNNSSSHSKIKRKMSLPQTLKYLQKNNRNNENFGEIITNIKYKVRQTSQPQKAKNINNNINYNNFKKSQNYSKIELKKSKSKSLEKSSENKDFEFNGGDFSFSNKERLRPNNSNIISNKENLRYKIKYDNSIKNELNIPFHRNNLIRAFFDQNFITENNSMSNRLNVSSSNKKFNKNKFNNSNLNINSIINRKEENNKKSSKRNTKKQVLNVSSNINYIKINNNNIHNNLQKISKSNINSSVEKDTCTTNNVNRTQKKINGHSVFCSSILNDNENDSPKNNINLKLIPNNFEIEYDNNNDTNKKIEQKKQNNLKKISEENTELNSFNFDDYKIITQLGQGTFSKIYLVQDKQNKIFSMKKIVLSDELDVQMVMKEFKMCCKLIHPNVVKLIGLYNKKLDKTTYVVYLLMEVGLTDWEKEIKSYCEKKIEYTEQNLIIIIKQLISALSFLQSKNVIHRDIKPQNILVFKGNIYKIADFGESKQIQNVTFSLMNGSLRGTELYMSPLLFNGLRNGQVDVKHNLIKSDVYSFGLCVLYASTLNNKALYEIRKFVEMKQVKEYIYKCLKNKFSGKFIELIISMLEIHENNRPDFAELNEILKSF